MKRTWAAEGLGLSQLAEQRHADLVLVGSRGLGGTDAILGSVSDLVVHHAASPVLVVPHPLLAAEYDALPDGPVLVGWDGSAGAETALTAAEQLLQRDVLLVSVDEGGSAAAPTHRPAGREARNPSPRERTRISRTCHRRPTYRVCPRAEGDSDRHGFARTFGGARNPPR